MLKPQLQKLTVCRPILNDDLITLLQHSLENPDEPSLPYEFTARIIEKAEELGLSGNLIRAYFIYILAYTETIFSRMTERTNGNIGKSLRQAFIKDMGTLSPFFQGQASAILQTELLDNYEPTEKRIHESLDFLYKVMEKADTAEKMTHAFLTFYHRYGYGDISSCKAFRWVDKRHELKGIESFEDFSLSDIIGYEHQKKQLINNTKAFLAGRPANNVLLIGARGTGKSSSVKALANEYFGQGLRLLQITKAQLTELPHILTALRKFCSKRFIIFLDDLSFDEFETEYKYLKSAIEGGVESCPDNVLIYATSNRRHLIKETWRDRTQEQDELYRQDSMNETVSLSDRFGLVITFLSPDQQQYLAIIDHYLQKENIFLEPQELRILGHRWELEHSGRSGRTARQFVTHYLGQIRKQKALQ